MIRSKAAFIFSVRSFFERSERPYFWTFTFREVHDVKVALALWEKFRKALWNFGRHPETGEQTIIGLRCFELHPGGHGVHVHCLLNRFINIHIVRRLSHKYGFGRDHVVRIHSLEHAETMADYMAKYCSKQDRPPCLKGRRLWAPIGKWGATRCKDIEVESEFVAAYRARRRVVQAEAAVAQATGVPYRLEHQLESMGWAQDHCFRVKVGKASALTGMIREISEPKPPLPDAADWEGLWSDLDVETLATERDAVVEYFRY